MSQRIDVYRPPYGRAVIEVPRTCVIVGTTNDDAFLVDPTGNRRFWPVAIDRPIDLAWVRENRTQLLAEAVAAHAGGEAWWLDAADSADLEAVTEEYHHEHPWSDPILAYVDGRPSVTCAEVLDKLDKPLERRTRGDEMQVAAILRRGGLTRYRAMMGGVQRWRWRR